MARYSGSLCRLCRRERVKLFLKGERCYTPKCPFEKGRGYPPGQHGKIRGGKTTDYGVQLREKQKLKRIYGLMEQQFRNCFKKAEQMKGITGENLLVMLERRLDSVVFRLGFATSRQSARQLVSHRHFKVNNRIVDRPSFLVKVGDVVELKKKSRDNAHIKEAVELAQQRGLAPWLEFDAPNFKGRIVAFPTREQLVDIPVKEHLVVELYSK